MSTAVIPEPIAQLQRQLDQIRTTQPRGPPAPKAGALPGCATPRLPTAYALVASASIPKAGAQSTQGSGSATV